MIQRGRDLLDFHILFVENVEMWKMWKTWKMWKWIEIQNVENAEINNSLIRSFFDDSEFRIRVVTSLLLFLMLISKVEVILSIFGSFWDKILNMKTKMWKMWKLWKMWKFQHFPHFPHFHIFHKINVEIQKVWTGYSLWYITLDR